jgi:hypothetical protein
MSGPGEAPAGEVDTHDRAAVVAGGEAAQPFMPPLVMTCSSLPPEQPDSKGWMSGSSLSAAGR